LWSHHRALPMSDDVLLTVEEAAALLRVNRKTLYEAVRLKQVPGVVRLGKVIRIGRLPLMTWINQPAPPLGREK
jgi:excisionase family DNA binding protein